MFDDSMKEAELLYEKLNYLRNTVDGILASGNINVWDVFGALSRTKRAVFNILTDNMQVHEPYCSTQKSVEALCMILVKEFAFNNLAASMDTDNIEDKTETLILWIEHHLLSHTLYNCITELFKEKKNQAVLLLYKEYSFMKNKLLICSFLECLLALEQNSLQCLTNLNKVLMNKLEFVEKLSNWITEKSSIESQAFQELSPSPFDRKSFSSLDFFDKCEKCLLPLSQGDLPSCTCNETTNLQYNNMNKRSSLKQQRSFNQEVLLKSALSVVSERHEQVPWYENENNLNDSENQFHLNHMKDLSLSEGNLLAKEKISNEKNIEQKNHDFVQSQELNRKNQLDGDFYLPRSSSRVQSKRKGHLRSKSDQMGHITVDEVDGIERSPSATFPMSTSLPKESNLHDELSKDSVGCYYYRSEDGYLFPKPYEGQSLISYLDSRSYDTGAQLDKENAHFSICEALITAIEQMRCQNDDSNDSDDGGIFFLKKKRLKKRLVIKSESKEEVGAFSDPSDASRSSTSFKTSSTFSSSASSNTDDAKNSDVGQQSSLKNTDTAQQNTDERTNLNISASWENVSLVKAKSPDMSRSNATQERIEVIEEEEIPPEEYSAETVAKSLLKKFHNRSIPAASELKWMVTEEEVPQQLLPLPTAWPINPDGSNDIDDPYSLKSGLRKISMPSLLRGNLEWAPPRPQIIFNPHKFVSRKIQLQRQHFRCAGCGLRVTPNLSKRFRYCDYIGKYFCTSCHQNRQSIIPSKILTKWDFKKYPVSDFAKELLKKIYNDPLFNIADIAPHLYQNIRSLSTIKLMRVQLHHVRRFFTTCRHADNCRDEFDKLSLHLSADPDTYSLNDLVNVKNAELHAVLRNILNDAISHITQDCLLCKAKGYVCEICKDGNDILYPFDLSKVSICSDCNTCYHSKCYVDKKCRRCERIKARKKLLQEEDTIIDDDG